MTTSEPRRQFRIGRWLAARTLRGRLIAGLLGLLALACASVGVVTYTHLHSVLVSQIDSELAAASARYAGCLHPPPGPHDEGHPEGKPVKDDMTPPSQCAQQQATAAFTALVRRSQVSDAYLASKSAPAPCRLTSDEEAQVAGVPVGRIVTVDLARYGSYQMTASQTPDGTIVTGLPLAVAQNTLQQVAITEISVFLAALLITGVIGTVWVRASMRPLRRVAATATRVTQLPLSSGEVRLPERVPDANPRTEVGQVGAAFNRMLGHIESALARREASESRLRTFAANASHELRTPLAAIRGYAELARRHRGPLPDDIAHALSRVESESARMSELVDELLLLARLDAGRPLESEPVDLSRLVLDVTSDARVAAPDHRWQLDLPEEPVLVRGDDLRLHQVVANLLSNAARHTPAGTQVTVSVRSGQAAGGASAPGASAPGASAPGASAGAQGGGLAIVSVTDNGPGIPAELQPDIFERFVRGDTSRSHAAGSSGLGLAIVHAVAVAHGGAADVASRPGETRFTITLPLLSEPPGGAR